MQDEERPLSLKGAAFETLRVIAAAAFLVAFPIAVLGLHSLIK